MPTANYWANQQVPQPASSWPNQPVPQPPAGAWANQQPAQAPAGSWPNPPAPPPPRANPWPNPPAPPPRAQPWPNPSTTQHFIGTAATMVDARSLPLPNQPALQPPPSAWPGQSPSQWGFNTPITRVEPALQPMLKPKGRGRGITAWTLWVLAGGLAAGPAVADYADQGVEAGMAWVSTWAPGFVRPYLPLPVGPSTAPARPSDQGGPPAATAVVVPAPIVVAKSTPEIVPWPAPAAAPAVNAKAKPTPTERQPHPAQARPVRGSHAKAPAAATPVKTRVALASPRPQSARSDPFDGDGGGTSAATVAKAAARPALEPAPVTRSAARSGDPLDDLMNGGVGETGDKGKRSASRAIDAMLKDVQKSEPPPPPKRLEPAPLPPLSAADITTAMAGVKSAAAGCGRRHGQNGVVDLKLAVGKDGRVSDVTVGGKFAGQPLGQCVAKAARGAAFPRSAGLKFDYRIAVQ